ncbi:hypothetical protein HDU78_005395 [Chytriomyces hyalinus]|nr:hypothetical protein HDU78_005395 [Chytriomyces hyalinus]KAJ3266276.1 hypothetical protein HDU77_001765 [Chytriomyces hyalinus]KAJ3407910.1 hypothetical protein HDU80_007368 [Chytriomyces hyalinus]
MDEWEDCPDTDASWVVMDIAGLSSDGVKEASKNGGVSLMGLDTATPYLRIGNMHFKGAFDSSLGTDLVFAASANASTHTRTVKDIVPTAPRYGLANAMLNRTGSKDATLTYMGKTETHIKFSRVRLEQKGVPPPASTATTATQGLQRV